MVYPAGSSPKLAGAVWADSPGMKLSDAIVDLVPGMVVIDLPVFDDGWSPADDDENGTASCMGRKVDLDDLVTAKDASSTGHRDSGIVDGLRG